MSSAGAVVPEALLSLPVRHRQLRLGTVSAVLVSADEAVLGMVVTSSWGGPEGYFPCRQRSSTAGGIESTPLALLTEADGMFSERRGARRVCRQVHAARRGLKVV